jgi:hypothetical protein
LIVAPLRMRLGGEGEVGRVGARGGAAVESGALAGRALLRPGPPRRAPVRGRPAAALEPAGASLAGRGLT